MWGEWDTNLISTLFFREEVAAPHTNVHYNARQPSPGL